MLAYRVIARGNHEAQHQRGAQRSAAAWRQHACAKRGAGCGGASK